MPEEKEENKEPGKQAAKPDFDDISPEPGPREKAAIEEINKMNSEITENNKKMDEVYDDKMRRLEIARKLKPTDEKAEEEHISRMQKLKEEYDELKSKISQARRAGKDVFISDLLSRPIGAKIKMAGVTREKKDYDLVETEIRRAEEELSQEEKIEPVNIKKELEKKLRMDTQRETGKVTEEDD